MAEVKVLIEGYVSGEVKGGKEKTRPTITLVKGNGIVMVVDPGVVEAQEMIIERLREEGLIVSDVNVVCITHSHLDHYRNIGMFPKAKTLEYWGLWNGNEVEDWKESFTEDIRVMKTPGHSYDGITLFIKTGKGVVAVCGDVFWKKGFPKNDPYASDKEKLKESRKKVLGMAEWIVPGHGKIFKAK
ncbi:MAG: MBL fold metallo-hydrolase [archaeon]